MFITGDRSIDPITAAVFVGQVLVALPEGTEVATGRLGGIEAAVRYLVPDALIYGTADTSDESLDARHVAAADDVSRVLVLHGDPLESRIYRSVLRAWTDDDAVTLLP